jgi:hypothetical protein
LAAALLALACGESPTNPAQHPGPAAQAEAVRGSADARPDLVETLREDAAAPRHPADGGGRAWVADETGAPVEVSAVAGRPTHLRLVYEAGPLGIAPGGAVVFQASPFWGWDPPQLAAPDAPGFAEVSTPAEGVALEPEAYAQGLLRIGIAGRALREGEHVEIAWTSRFDRFAERDSRLWISVDGDGDGVRALVSDPPAVEVVAGPPARLVATLPTTARPGDPVRLTLAVLDGAGNAGPPFAGEIELDVPAGLELPARVAFAAQHRGRRALECTAPAPGVYRVRARGPDGLAAESNPLVVAPEAPRVLWADLHGHSGLSDGTGTPDDYYAYARDVAALDVAALTDHDHWGMLPLDAHPALWQSIRGATRRYHEPGRFVTLLGYEWTSWLYGHRHVLFFADEGELWSTLAPETETPDGLWRALRAWSERTGVAALTFAHHSAGGPISTDWSFAPDPRIEPVTEVVSVHGSSEAADAPGAIYKPVPGNFVRDALGRGLRFGFVGSGDSHDGHPGLAHLASGSGGLAAILCEELSREGVLAALRERRAYATNGPRIHLRFALDGRPMGSTLPPAAATDAPAEQELDWAVAAAGPVARVVLVRGGAIVGEHAGGGLRELSGRIRIPRLGAGEYVYLRVEQEDGGAAWSSPIFQD